MQMLERTSLAISMLCRPLSRVAADRLAMGNCGDKFDIEMEFVTGSLMEISWPPRWQLGVELKLRKANAAHPAKVIQSWSKHPLLLPLPCYQAGYLIHITWRTDGCGRMATNYQQNVSR